MSSELSTQHSLLITFFWHPNRFASVTMRQKPKAERRCTYVVSIDKDVALRSLADYLSLLGTNGCDVIVLDSSSRDAFEENRRVLRWVSRHIAVAAPLDIVRTA